MITPSGRSVVYKVYRLALIVCIVTSCSPQRSPEEGSSITTTAPSSNAEKYHAKYPASILDQYAEFRATAEAANEDCGTASTNAAERLSSAGDDPDMLPIVRGDLLHAQRVCLASARKTKSAMLKVHIKDKRFLAEFNRTMSICPDALRQASKGFEIAATFEPGAAASANTQLQASASAGAVCSGNLRTFTDEVNNGI